MSLSRDYLGLLMSRRPYIWEGRDKRLELGKHTRVMGVVNITPDSFSDGGQFLEREKAVEQCLRLVESGAHMLDLGGESSRPGAGAVLEEVELERIMPVLQEVRQKVSVPISIDTYKAEVARQVLSEGADAINDISAFRFDAKMPAVVKEWDAGIILMHMRGTPKEMQQLPPSLNILQDIRSDLQVAISKAFQHGVERERIMIDPGIGFGKTVEDNCQILNQLSFLEPLQLPILVGSSRKNFLGRILNRPEGQRSWGSAASVAAAIMRGAHVVRVHDVEEMEQVARVTDSILSESVLQ